MIFEEAYNDIISSFGSLWNFKERGGSLEIITPYATTSQKFISVFLTKRDNDYIVTDGGWIHEGVYNNSFDKGAICFNKSLHHFQSSFHILEVQRQSGIIYFYKKTDNKVAIPSLIFDMSNFISAVASLSEVDFREEDQYDPCPCRDF